MRLDDAANAVYLRNKNKPIPGLDAGVLIWHTGICENSHTISPTYTPYLYMHFEKKFNKNLENT